MRSTRSSCHAEGVCAAAGACASAISRAIEEQTVSKRNNVFMSSNSLSLRRGGQIINEAVIVVHASRCQNSRLTREGIHGPMSHYRVSANIGRVGGASSGASHLETHFA